MIYKPEIASDIWSKILKHKWILSEELGRDVGLRTSCIDFLENTDQAADGYFTQQRKATLREMGAQSDQGLIFFVRSYWFFDLG
jgi:hypothetical protein